MPQLRQVVVEMALARHNFLSIGEQSRHVVCSFVCTGLAGFWAWGVHIERVKNASKR